MNGMVIGLLGRTKGPKTIKQTNITWQRKPQYKEKLKAKIKGKGKHKDNQKRKYKEKSKTKIKHKDKGNTKAKVKHKDNEKRKEEEKHKDNLAFQFLQSKLANPISTHASRSHLKETNVFQNIIKLLVPKKTTIQTDV